MRRVESRLFSKRWLTRVGMGSYLLPSGSVHPTPGGESMFTQGEMFKAAATSGALYLYELYGGGALESRLFSAS